MTWNEFELEINSLNDISGIESFVAGYSTLGQEIRGYHIGDKDGKQIFIEGGMHLDLRKYAENDR